MPERRFPPPWSVEETDPKLSVIRLRVQRPPELIRVAGAWGYSRVPGIGSHRDVIPGIQHPVMRCNRCSPLRVAVVIRGVEHSTMHLTRCSPWRVAEWQIVWRAGM
jgi:hypothetical protein